MPPRKISPLQLAKAKDGKLVLKFYKTERKGKRRKRWLKRIYHRYSYPRRKNEMNAVASGELFFEGPKGPESRRPATQ